MAIAGSGNERRGARRGHSECGKKGESSLLEQIDVVGVDHRAAIICTVSETLVDIIDLNSPASTNSA